MLEAYSDGPVLIFGSIDDHIVPFDLNYADLAKIKGVQGKCFEMGRHNVAVWNEREFYETLERFLQKV